MSVLNGFVMCLLKGDEASASVKSIVKNASLADFKISSIVEPDLNTVAFSFWGQSAAANEQLQLLIGDLHPHVLNFWALVENDESGEVSLLEGAELRVALTSSEDATLMNVYREAASLEAALPIAINLAVAHSV